MIAGTYIMDLYCDHELPNGYKCGQSCQFADSDSRDEATRDARKARWLVNWKTYRALCPKHSGKRKEDR